VRKPRESLPPDQILDMPDFAEKSEREHRLSNASDSRRRGSNVSETSVYSESAPLQDNLEATPTLSDIREDAENSYQWMDVFNIRRPSKKKKKRRKRHKRRKRGVKSTRPTSEMLKSMHLNAGRNTIKFIVSSSLQGEQVVEAAIYLWPHTQKIVVSDVDGTITKSDVLGQLMPWIGSNWSHNGVAEFYTNIAKNGYQLLYLTSRAIGQADLTRQYLFEIIEQYKEDMNSGEQWFVLPEGPVIMAPDSLLGALHREVIKKKPQEFKIPALEDIRNLFPAHTNPFFAAFGNRMTDLVSYLAVGVPKHRAFIIDPNGNMHSSNLEFLQTYETLNAFVDDMFVSRNPANSQVDVPENFSNVNYWREPIMDPEELPDLE